MHGKGWTEKLARACARRPWVTVAAWACAMVAAIILMTTLLGDALVMDVKPTNNPESKQAQDIIDRRLGKSEVKVLDEMMIVRSQTLTVDDPLFQSQVEQLYGSLTAMGLEVVLGGVHYYMTRDESLVSPDRHTTMIPFTMPGNGDKKMEQVYSMADQYTAGGVFEVFHTGNAAFSADSARLGEKQAQNGETIGILVALVVLAVVFGALAAAFLPVALGGVAIIVALGLTALVGQAMDLTFTVTNMISMMGLAVGIDYSLFILTRFREERKKGLNKMDAIGTAGATASRAVFFSGMTVVLALTGLVLFPLSIFISMGIGSILVVLAAIAASLTLLPAMLSLLGDKVNSLRIPFIQPKESAQKAAATGGFWTRMTRVVMRVPVFSIIVVVVILASAAIPYFSRNAGMSGISGLPDYLRSKQGYLVLQKEFHIGMDVPAIIVIDGDISSEKTRAGIASLQSSLKNDAAFTASVVVPHPEKNMAVVYAGISGDPLSKQTMDAVKKLRTETIPQAFKASPVKVLVTGETAGILDFNQTTSDYTPIIFAFVLSLSFIILTLAFRSIVISITAILMNLLSVGAAWGLVVLVFQKGFGAGLFGFQQVDSIETWLPLFLFALLFGLSMDYHVFLLSRVRERYNQTRDNTEAVSFGLKTTGKLITGAALIMVAVFGGFALGDLVMLEQMGFGLAVAVFLDATLIRCVLVPATMKLLGKSNWYLPQWLRWIPNVSLGESAQAGAADSAARPEPVIRRPVLSPLPVPSPVVVENENGSNFPSRRAEPG
jgi:putative drug exporter of the RND superfamily